MHKSSSTTLSGNFAPNMFFSDEPGYYEDGNYGIRLETILRVIPAIEALADNYGKYITQYTYLSTLSSVYSRIFFVFVIFIKSKRKFLYSFGIDKLTRIGNNFRKVHTVFPHIVAAAIILF